jgi:predicted HicB family RNase H-like nuclease
MFKYGNYIAKPEVDSDAGILYGKVLNISAVIAFQGENVREAEQNFRKAVDLYVETCRAQGKEPEKPFSGKLPFRTTPEIHRDIYMAATQANKSINAWMEEVLSSAAKRSEKRPSALPEDNRDTEISIKEYEQLLSLLNKKLSHLENQVKRHLEKKPGNFDYFFKDLKPFLTDKEFPELIEKVEAFHERLKSIQAQETPFLSFLLSPETVPETSVSTARGSESSNFPPLESESVLSEDVNTVLEGSRRNA